MKSTYFNNHLLLDAAPNGGAFPDLSGGTLHTIKLDEKDHNVEPSADITSVKPGKTVLSMDDIFAGKPSDEDGFKSLPANRTKPAEEKAHEAAAADDDPNAPAPKEEDEPEPAAKEKKPPIEKPEEPAKEPTEEPLNTEELPKGRDYSGLDAEDVKILKGTNNYHFKKFYPLLQKYVAKATAAQPLQAKVVELEKTLADRGTPVQWFDHPEAFTLSPEFRTLQTNYDKLAAEQAFYEQQAANIMDGKEFFDLRHYDKAGNPVYSNPQKPTNQDLVRIQGLISQYTSTSSQIQGRVGAMQTTFQKEHKDAATAILDGVNRHIQTMPKELHPDDKQFAAFKAVVPKPFQAHPMTEVAAKMYGILVKLGEDNQKLRAEKTKIARVANDVKEAGVKTTQLPRNGASSQGMFKTKAGYSVPKVLDMADILGG